MNYFKHILLTKKLDNKSLASLLNNNNKAHFYLGYLSQTLNVKNNQVLNANLKLIKNNY